MYGRIYAYDDERNPKLYLVESEVPRVKSYLGLTKTREQPESAVVYTVRKLSYAACFSLQKLCILYI